MAIWRLDPEVEPRSVGVDPAVLERMVSRFNEAVEAGEMFAGAQMAMYRRR